MMSLISLLSITMTYDVIFVFQEGQTVSFWSSNGIKLSQLS